MAACRNTARSVRYVRVQSDRLTRSRDQELIKDFEKNIAVIASTFIENVKGMMAQCRDLENRHHEKLLEVSINTLEKSVKNELDEDLPDDVRELLVDKTTLVNMVNASHSVHLLKIDMRECDILTNAYRWQASVTGKAFQDEIDRNRNRVKEIFQYIDNLQEQLDNSLQEQLDSIVLVEPPE